MRPCKSCGATARPAQTCFFAHVPRAVVRLPQALDVARAAQPGWRGRNLRAHCRRDPLEAEIWSSWQDSADDWDSERFSEEELIDILFDEDGSAETAAQNILAIALTLVLALAAGSILWRLALVSWALVSAGIRYSVVAVLLLVLAMFFF